MNLKRFIPNTIRLWQLVLPLLLVSNLAYSLHNILGWVITLGFFLIVPGYLFLRTIKAGDLAFGETLSMSVGLSISILIFMGLILNGSHIIGINRPLTTFHVFVFFDIVSLFLIAINIKVRLKVNYKPLKFTPGQLLVFILCTIVPFIAIGGIFRLNNGGSNILVLCLMALIATLFIFLPTRTKLEPLYPYAIFVIAISILFCNSLRGWNITGHDIHHEFAVFQATLNQGFWRASRGGDPYNACLSITLLPTIIAKLTTIPDAYIYKVVFQVIFASFIPTLYYMFKRFTTPGKALLGAFVFMTFPTFTNDLPFLNRQEIAFVFVILLLFVNFSNIVYRAKILLTIIFMMSIILSHYSSSYVTLLLLLVSPLFYRLLTRKSDIQNGVRFPLLNIRIILIAILITFAWNSQITASTGNLRNTIVNTFINVLGPASQREDFRYSLTNVPTSEKPFRIFNAYAAKNPDGIELIKKEQLPVTKLGHLLGRLTGLHNAEGVNVVFHALLAKVLQLLVIVGTLILLYRKRSKSTPHERYLIALSCASLFALMLFTVLPQLAVDYDVTRLFQQSLMFLWLPSILFAEMIFFFLGRHRQIGAAALFAFLYLNLAGFIPQITGGFPPQLPLNNSGVYYDYFYGHESDIIGTNWLAKNRDVTKDIKFDTGAVIPTVPFRYGFGLVDANHPGYLYRDFTDTTRQSYRLIIEGYFVEYRNPAITRDRELIYANTYAQIYLK